MADDQTPLADVSGPAPYHGVGFPADRLPTRPATQLSRLRGCRLFPSPALPAHAIPQLPT